MSTLGMRPRRGGHSEYASPTSPRISTYKTWREQLSRDISEKASGQDSSSAPVFDDTDEEDEQNNERTQNKMQEDTENPIKKSRKEAEEDEEIIQQLFQTSNPTQHARKSINIPDTSSESIDESEEEIRQTIENFRRRDAARRSARYTGIDTFRPAALWKADSKARERKSKSGKRAKAEGKNNHNPATSNSGPGIGAVQNPYLSF